MFGSEYEEPALVALCIYAYKKVLSVSELLGLSKEQLQMVLDKLLLYNITDIKNKTVISYKHMAGLPLSNIEKDFLLDNGLDGVSTFLSIFYFDAVNDIFGEEKALELIKQYYGGMLDLGATTFWENYSPTWNENSIKIDELPDKNKNSFHADTGSICFKGLRKSLCHGWSAGVIKVLYKILERTV